MEQFFAFNFAWGRVKTNLLRWENFGCHELVVPKKRAQCQFTNLLAHLTISREVYRLMVQQHKKAPNHNRDSVIKTWFPAPKYFVRCRVMFCKFLQQFCLAEDASLLNIRSDVERGHFIHLRARISLWPRKCILDAISPLACLQCWETATEKLWKAKGNIGCQSSTFTR